MTAPAFENHLRSSPDPAPASDDRLVEFVGVQKTFDGVSYVVRDLDLTIRRGEFMSLLGPSGSGKTTTLMMLAGFEDPSAGDILLNGERLSGTPPHRRGMGVVFQNYALFPHMTVTRNIAYPLVQRRLPKPEIARRVGDVMRLVGLADYGERRPHQLSGGQQQRVALARALVFEPRLVLMDEPLGALDKQLREQMQYELKRLHRKLGVTMVFVTHDQGEALTMSDRIAVFNEGRIQQVDTPKAIYEHPETAFVASFIGENNRLDGVVETVEADRCVVRTTCGLRIVGSLGGSPGGSPEAGPPARGPCIVSIRPESVLIGPPAADLPNRQDGTVRQIIYGGDHLRIEVALAKGADFVAKVPASGLDEQIVEGAGIAVGWLPERCQILSAS